MFRDNDQQMQSDFFDPFQLLGEELRQQLETSWAGTFYREIFCRIDEAPFAVLYSDEPSPPNAAVNVLLGAEILKAGFGWSDQDLYDDLRFNMQVCYALGLRDMSAMPFELHTLYDFRRRLSQSMQQSGENLLEQALVRVTDEQLASLKRKSGHPCIDPVMVSDSIRQMNRLHLLVEVVQDVWRMLTEKDRAHYTVLFRSYPRGAAGQYSYQVEPADVPQHLMALGHLMRRLVEELEARYGSQHAYEVLEWVYKDHFALKGDQEAGPDKIRLGAADTSEPENEVQLITPIQVAPNAPAGEQFLVEGLSSPRVQTSREALWTDDRYKGSDAEGTFQREPVEHIPANIRNWRTAPDRFGLETFSWELDRNGTPATVKCPGGQQVEIKKGRKADRFAAYFEQAGCETCAFVNGCPARPVKRRGGRSLNVSLRQVQVALLRQRAAQTREAGNS